MTTNPKIPMLPEELPQQHIYKVVDLPERSEPFNCIVGYGEVPESVVPKHGSVVAAG